MSNIKRKLDKVFQIYTQSGVNNRLIFIRDVAILLFLKSMEDYPPSYLSNMGIGQTIWDDHKNWRLSSLLHFDQDTVKKVFYDEIIPFFYENLKEYGFDILTFGFKNELLSSANFYIILGEIEDIFVKELDGESINESNLVIYDDIFENLLDYLPRGLNACNFAPKHLRRLLCELIQVKYTDRVYDQNMGSGRLLIEAYHCMAVSDAPKYRIDVDDDGFEYTPKNNDNMTTDYFRKNLVLEGNEQGQMLKWLCFLNFYFHRINLLQAQFSKDDNLETLESNKYDKVFCVHPQNGYYENLNAVMECLKYRGKAAVVIPQLFLYGDSRKIKKIREMLVTRFIVDGVITLPKYEFYPFSLLPSAILIFRLADEENFNRSDIWLCNLKNDGYSNDKKRARTSDTPLPVLLDAFRARSEFDNEWFESKNISLQDVLNNENSLFVDEYIDNENETDIVIDPHEIMKSLDELQEKLKNGIDELKNYI